MQMNFLVSYIFSLICECPLIVCLLRTLEIYSDTELVIDGSKMILPGFPKLEVLVIGLEQSIAGLYFIQCLLLKAPNIKSIKAKKPFASTFIFPEMLQLEEYLEENMELEYNEYVTFVIFFAETFFQRSFEIMHLLPTLLFGCFALNVVFFGQIQHNFLFL